MAMIHFGVHLKHCKHDGDVVYNRGGHANQDIGRGASVALAQAALAKVDGDHAGNDMAIEQFRSKYYEGIERG
jgi:hypothetical protein